ncbi:MAG: urea amidolyase [Rhodobacteraceae bacterium]|nr:urea amidolyase [Paracoccaceae bacterium]
MSGLRVRRVGPVVSVQDLGRPGYLSRGVAQGGVADTTALYEGAALLGQSPALAALEMGGMGGEFEALTPLRIALTGAPMVASIDGAALTWNSSCRLEVGQVLSIGAARKGVYGYLHVGGGFDSDEHLGARSVHMAAGLGQPVQTGEVLKVGADLDGETGLVLAAEPRFEGGEVRIVESFQSALFSPETRLRLGETEFRRGQRANRMGVELTCDGPPFQAENQLNILSEVITPGDVQMTGDGKPFVLLRECQTTGGYPRIGTVLPCDLPKVAQAPAGSDLKLKWVTLEEGLEANRRYEVELKALPRSCQPMVRNPAGLPDLLSYQLVGGVVSAFADPFEKES